MEIWDIYDQNRKRTGRTHKRGLPMADGDYHIVVSVWIINENGDILLTKRHPDKSHPNLWEGTGGSILAGENSLEGALREVKEEIGVPLSKKNGKLVKSTRRDGFHDFKDDWLFAENVDIRDVVLQEEEVVDIKWVTRKELKAMYDSHQLVPTLRYVEELL
ncbi:NUDIX hydrolase [Gracilibacillus salinarum]|uniref:NUDIX domain-containing protein n=1 Tax=Gracilibacillus salinarum TaxID=2932255 RepID=A0ABY4GT73_9BACI|nr:NUDIX domain-containing protein [Gracilibacillus salinarum]UOQ87170.1 NUDIX domain-containing protein [Gracilibacillus salinarum]